VDAIQDLQHGLTSLLDYRPQVVDIVDHMLLPLLRA
jgi:hypothetical protein